MKIFPEKLGFLLPGAVLALLAITALLIFGSGTGLLSGIITLSEYGEESIQYHTSPGEPEMNWQIATLVGIWLGAIFYSIFSGKFKVECNYNSNGSGIGKFIKTALCGIAGGFLVMCAIQISGNSVWGHISNAIQLSSGSWIFLASTLFSGMIAVLLLDGANSGNEAKKSASAGKNSTKSSGRSKR